MTNELNDRIDGGPGSGVSTKLAATRRRLVIEIEVEAQSMIGIPDPQRVGDLACARVLERVYENVSHCRPALAGLTPQSDLDLGLPARIMASSASFTDCEGVA